MSSQTTLVYSCPHCQAKVEFGGEKLGQVVNCPRCERPFRAEAPSSFPIDEDGSVLRKGEATSDGEPVDAERILVVTHTAVLRRGIVGTLVSILLVVGGIVAAVWGLVVSEAWLGWGGLAAAVVGGLVLLYRWFQSLFMTLTVTNRRAILRTGLISKATSEVNHDDVRNIQIDQSMIDRMLNIGDLMVSSAGQDTVEIRVKAIRDPEGVASMIREYQN